jgi:hypothetical protein
MLLLWDQKLLLRMRHCFESSKSHSPTPGLDAEDACMRALRMLKKAFKVSNHKIGTEIQIHGNSVSLQTIECTSTLQMDQFRKRAQISM